MNREVRGKGGKRRRTIFIEVPDDRRMIREELQRLIVERRKTVNEKRRVSVGHDCSEQMDRCDAPP